MNRLQAPSLVPISTIKFVKPFVSNSLPCELIWINDVADETVRFELHFNAGTIHGDILVSSLTSALLLSGTNTKTTTQIHEELNFLGAYVDLQVSTESAVVVVYCLREYFDSVLEILFDALANVVFPQQEIEDLLQDRKQQFLVNSQKMSFLARRIFNTHFYTNDERYGRITTLEMYNNVSQEIICDFHKKYYLNGLERIVCVANIDEKLIQKWHERFALWNNKQPMNFLTELQNTPTDIYEEKEDAIQTAIRIGFPLFNKTAHDYVGMSILQTILGDYFGSRLMSNLREDKGYTYGIGSGILETFATGHLIIATEVKKEAQADALVQIKHEIQRLKDEKVSEEELQLVKNYLLGQLLKGADGSDALMDLFLNVHLHNLDLDFYNRYIKRVKNITSEELQQLAQQYLDIEKATIVKVG